MEGHQYTEATLIESLQALKRSIRRLEGIMSLERAKETGIGFYESEIERERKWNTKKNTKHLSY